MLPTAESRQNWAIPGHSNWIGGDDIWFSAKLKAEANIYVTPFDYETNQLRHPEELPYACSPDYIWLSEKSRGFTGWNRGLKHFEPLLRLKARSLD